MRLEHSFDLPSIIIVRQQTKNAPFLLTTNGEHSNESVRIEEGGAGDSGCLQVVGAGAAPVACVGNATEEGLSLSPGDKPSTQMPTKLFQLAVSKCVTILSDKKIF